MAVRGSALVAVLMVLAVLFVLGLAMLTKQVQAYQGSHLVLEGAQAQAVAEAGLEDARLKLEKDLDFPPRSTPDQTSFTYSEDLLDGSGRLVGTYEVTVDRLYAGPPTWLIRITVTGTCGPHGERASSQRLVAELDVAEKSRSGSGADNPNFFRFVEVQSEGP